jgi:hypothetical protein
MAASAWVFVVRRTSLPVRRKPSSRSQRPWCCPQVFRASTTRGGTPRGSHSHHQPYSCTVVTSGTLQPAARKSGGRKKMARLKL